MNFNNFTIKSQEVVQKAIDYAKADWSAADRAGPSAEGDHFRGRNHCELHLPEDGANPGTVKMMLDKGYRGASESFGRGCVSLPRVQ